MSTSDLSTTVIIPTYNGKHKILKTLHALEAQLFADFETIIVIDGSTDDTSGLLKKNSFSLNLRIHHQQNLGRASVRNKGAALANGNLLIFYDDDMSPEPDSVLRHVQFHQKHKNAICGGNQLEKEEEAQTDFDKFRCQLRHNWLKKYHKPLNEIHGSNLFLTAANFSISKSMFLELGSFNPELNDAEDLELANRTIKEGYSIFFDKLNICWHDDFISCKQYIQRRRQYSIGYQKLRKIEPDLIYDRLIKLNVIKRLLFSLMSHKYWLAMIDNQQLKFLPQPIRFKLYDVVVTGLGSVYINRAIG